MTGAAVRMGQLLDELSDRDTCRAGLIDEIRDLLGSLTYREGEITVSAGRRGTSVNFGHVTFGYLATIGVIPGAPVDVYQPTEHTIAVANSCIRRSAMARSVNEPRSSATLRLVDPGSPGMAWQLLTNLVLPKELHGAYTLTCQVGDVAALAVLP